ncbi:Transmembrane and TPR repeat-containing protein [Nymphon striatum]|nr:Transmembrane and TPR repeat-containing protein [Nymphon striatum]
MKHWRRAEKVLLWKVDKLRFTTDVMPLGWLTELPTIMLMMKDSIKDNCDSGKESKHLRYIFDNPASAEETPYRQLTYNYLLTVNSWLLLFPSNLCCDWTMGTIPIISSILDLRNISTIVFYIILAKLIHSTGILQSSNWSPPNRDISTSHQNVVIMSLALMGLPFLPASNLFFPVGFVVAERILYLPSMGFCMLVAYGWNLLNNQQWLKKMSWIAAVFLILIHACKTVRRNNDWENEISIFTSGIAVNGRNAKLYNNVGHALEGKEQYEEALEYFQKAVSVQSDDIGAHINVGRTFNNLKMYSEAEKAYYKAKDLLPRPKPREPYQTRIAPNHLNVFLNLANLISRNESRLEEADALYRQAISMRADYTQAYINRGEILIKMNRTKEAQEVYEKALQYDNNNPDIYYNLGVVFIEQGKNLQALAYLDKALEFDPEHEQALMNSAVLIQETGNPSLQDVAYKRLLRLLEKDQMNERAYFNLGMLGMDQKNYVKAEKWFKMSIELKENFRSALFNLALLLSERNRPLEAVPYLQQLLKFHPDHIKGLILLGDIFINSVRDLDRAEECYDQIMALDANNVQAMHNLCVVYVEQGKLEKAEKCMTKAALVAPHEEYIQRHLKILRMRILKKLGDVKSGDSTKIGKEVKQPS